MISRMSLVEIVGPRHAFNAAVDAIQAAGVVHIEDVPLSESDTGGLLHRIHLCEADEREKAEYEELNQLVDGAIAGIPPAARAQCSAPAEIAKEIAKWENLPASVVAASAKSLHAEARSFARRQRNLAEDLSVLSSYEEVVTALAPLIEGSEFPETYESIGLVFERGNHKAKELLEERLRELAADQSQLLDAPMKGGRIAVVAGFHKEFDTEVRAFIEEAGISEVRAPRHLRDKPFEEAVTTLREEIATLTKEHDAVREDLHRFLSENGARLLAIQCVCRDRFSRLDAVAKFAQTRYTFICKGWIPQASIEELQQRLTAACGEAAIVRPVRTRGTGGPPVQLDNTATVKPFEPLLSLLPLPQYGTIDPTLYVALFFPPIFGLMLGDIGYGLILAVMAGLLYAFNGGRQIQKKLAIVLACCAAFTIVFGFVFGELFGDYGHHLGLKPILFERLSFAEGVDNRSALLGYLAIAVGVGVAHIMWGLVLGIVNARKAGDHSRAVDCAARIVGLFGLGFLIGWGVGALPTMFLVFGVIALVVFLGLTVRQAMHEPVHGLMMPLELLGTVGNILSYARIMAVGLVSVVLALLANRFGSMIGNGLLAALVILLVHALNVGLGIVDPTIQGIRLHYVEFFSKFYVSGGRPYAPFAKARREGA